MARSLLNPLVVAFVLGAACTPSGLPEEVTEVEADEPAQDPVEPENSGVVEEPTVDDECSRHHEQDPVRIGRTDLRPTPLTDAVQWSSQVDARGGYAHRVDIDARGHVTWAHDRGSMQFIVERFDLDGRRTWSRRTKPAEHQPEALDAAAAGEVVLGGNALTTGPRAGEAITAFDVDGRPRWRTRTPRLDIRRLAFMFDGRVGLFASSGRRKVTLGDHTMVNRLSAGRLMDVLAVLDATGTPQWSRSFLPGVLDMRVHDELMVVASHVGASLPVDYGSGANEGPGVLAAFDVHTGQSRWAVEFNTGLWAVRSVGADLLAVGFDATTTFMGGRTVSGTMAAWIGPSGCYRGSVVLGHGISRIATRDDGSFVVAGPAGSRTLVRQVGETMVEVPAEHWFVAEIDASLEPQGLHTVRCDDLRLAAGPRSRVAVSCFTDLSQGESLRRRYELMVLERSP